MRPEEIYRQIAGFLVERHGRRLPVAAASRFDSDLGLSSMDVAALVARLQEGLGAPPAEAVAPTDLRTVGDLCDALGGGAGEAGDDPLAEARARAAARRGSRSS